MAFITNIGGAVLGEFFLTPITEDGMKMVAKLYGGGVIDLIEFKKPLEVPEEGSAFDRLSKLEDNMEFIMKTLTEIKEHRNSENLWENEYSKWVNDELDDLGVTVTNAPKLTDVNSDLANIDPANELDTKMADLIAFIATRDTLIETDKAYLINNIETLFGKR